tara:strand:+ start:10294 stop:10554 length:261 start_codon:yes stop_codon:yes gene_type:complete
MVDQLINFRKANMETIQYQNHPRQKESFIENERVRLSRFQDPRDGKWYAFVETKSDEFHLFSGPWKQKYKATEQIRIWYGDDDLIF